MSTYVYGIVHDDESLDGLELSGVGREPAPVRFVRARGIAAVVSDAPEGLRAKRRDLTAHQEVLQELTRRRGVLPMRFGVVSEDDDAVTEQLRDKGDHYSTLLSRLEGRVEFNVKAVYVEEEVLKALLRDDRALKERNESLRRAGGGTPAERMAFGERVARALEERKRRDADIVVRPLTEHAERVATGPLVDGCLTNTSFLLPWERREEFLRRAATVQQEMDAYMDVRVNGPMPPYSFVEPPRN